MEKYTSFTTDPTLKRSFKRLCSNSLITTVNSCDCYGSALRLGRIRCSYWVVVSSLAFYWHSKNITENTRERWNFRKGEGTGQGNLSALGMNEIKSTCCSWFWSGRSLKNNRRTLSVWVVHSCQKLYPHFWHTTKWRRVPILVLNRHVAVSYNQPLHNRRIPTLCLDVQRCAPIIHVQITVTASVNQLDCFRDGVGSPTL